MSLSAGVLATRVSTAAWRRRRRLLFLSMWNTSYRGSTAAPTIRAASRLPATAATPTKGRTSRASIPHKHCGGIVQSAWRHPEHHFAVRGGRIFGLTRRTRRTRVTMRRRHTTTRGSSGAIRLRSSGSLVTMACPALCAHTTTCASTTSAVEVRASNRPTAVASGPLSAMRSVPACRISRESRACLAWPALERSLVW